jgi:hypothetical protein
MREWKYPTRTAPNASPPREIIEWCRNNIEDGLWDYAWENIYFVREKDYTFFMLRWA